MDQQYYWQIVERDGTVTYVPPQSVEIVKRRWENGQPIKFDTKVVPAHQITKFTITSRPYGKQQLIEGVAQAFKEPIYVEYESKGRTYHAIKGRWVKMTVTSDKWNRYYSVSPGYVRLGEVNDMVVIAFVLAVHDIDTQKVDYCTEDEVQQLTKV